jgi:hypothetical protein
MKTTKNYKITIEGPGSEGHLLYAMDESEFKAFERFTEFWNDYNSNHSAPFIKVDDYEASQANNY